MCHSPLEMNSDITSTSGRGRITDALLTQNAAGSILVKTAKCCSAVHRTSECLAKWLQRECVNCFLTVTVTAVTASTTASQHHTAWQC